jgi:hypothetical protein
VSTLSLSLFQFIQVFTKFCYSAVFIVTSNFNLSTKCGVCLVIVQSPPEFYHVSVCQLGTYMAATFFGYTHENFESVCLNRSKPVVRRTIVYYSRDVSSLLHLQTPPHFKIGNDTLYD